MIFIYIVIFEFVLIPIKFIPKPSILFDSFISLWDSYNLVALLFSTTSIIYLSLVIGYFLISISAKYLLKIVYEFPGMMNLSVPFKYFSIFFFALLFNLWFSDSLTAEFFFAILVVISFLLSVLNKSSKNTKEEYILTAKSLGLNNNEISKWSPAEREIGYVPQDGALFKTMTVAQNIGFALKIRKWKPNKIDKRVNELADVFSIKHLLERQAIDLSGGEKQRIALARALSFYPDVLCLDEPLSALDEDTKDGMFELLTELKINMNITVACVTEINYRYIELSA